jgi:hypothetical protein
VDIIPWIGKGISSWSRRAGRPGTGSGEQLDRGRQMDAGEQLSASGLTLLDDTRAIMRAIDCLDSCRWDGNKEMC